MDASKRTSSQYVNVIQQTGKEISKCIIISVELEDSERFTACKLRKLMQTLNKGKGTSFLPSFLPYLLTYSLTPWCRILFQKLIVTLLIKKYLAFFMEPEGSLPCSHKPATGPYPEPAESSSSHR
jgi:hypothetical protein